jgi:UDP-N-acetylglucosamine 2-epimerase (non-hydrolysing)
MRRLRVLSVFGSRPEAIKMAPLVRRLSEKSDFFESILCVTGQHREMLDQVLTTFGIVPDYDFDLMKRNQKPARLAARVMMALEPVLARAKPDWVLLQGDTTTVLAAAIVAHYHKARVGHVEAGLRTWDFGNPFPEEMNRVVADHVSDLLFSPTALSRENLVREGIPVSRIFVTGNTVIDALLDIAHKPVSGQSAIWLGTEGVSDLFERCDRERKKLILVTAHRRENHGKPIRDICRAIRRLADQRPEIQFAFPVHRNPNISKPVHELLGNLEGIRLLPPVDYFTLVQLMRRSTLILTDSGGLQEEAPSLGVPVLVLRETTERPEAVAAGTARLVGTDPDHIVQETNRVLDDRELYRSMARAMSLYGDGHASERVVQVLVEGRCEEFRPTLLEAKAV